MAALHARGVRGPPDDDALDAAGHRARPRGPDLRPERDPAASTARATAEPVAFAIVRIDEPEPGVRTGEIGLVGVLPAWRGRGLGRELVRWGVTELRRRGAAGIELSVEAENERATDLYRRHGFEPTVEWPHWVLPAG